jgi:hypothetical protein
MESIANYYDSQTWKNQNGRKILQTNKPHPNPLQGAGKITTKAH